MAKVCPPHDGHRRHRTSHLAVACSSQAPQHPAHNNDGVRFLLPKHYTGIDKFHGAGALGDLRRKADLLRKLQQSSMERSRVWSGTGK